MRKVKRNTKDISRMSEEQLSERLVKTLLGIVGIVLFVTIALVFFAPKIGSFFGLFSVHRNDKDVGPVIKPNPPIFSNVPESVKDTKVTLNGFGQSGLTVKLFLNGPEVSKTVIGADGFFTFPDIPLINGQNTFFAKAADSNSGESDKSQTYTINVDTQKPKLELTNIKDKQVIRNLDKRIEIIGKTDEKSTIVINERQVIQRPDFTFSYILGVDEGDVKLKIEATDTAGNTETKELTVVYQKRGS